MVRVEGEEMWALLRSLDDPDHLETPADFDFEATRARFERLVSALDIAFDCRCDADRSVQDASLHARVVVPAQAMIAATSLVLRVSNFGALTTLAMASPGALDSAGLEVLLGDDAARVYAVLDGLGYVVLPEDQLRQSYDGPSEIALPGDPRATWWLRYFDYF